ncbi:hypothetical protein [Paenibacillus aestuarii]|uniref:DUF2642 domain-containing protein n=1 Tax=Paenibacillus aestuarii TaxID=516965 RepID=A0ABW0KDL1_9BACL|nr:hypothetical protein [Paenibacillus aestuarii]
MQRIDPINEQTCAALYGKPVLMFLQDGAEIFGTLSRIEDGKLIINDQSAQVAAKPKKKAKAKIKKSAKKVKISQEETVETPAFVPYGFPYGVAPYGTPPVGTLGFGYDAAISVDIAALAALFAL